jgi:hypothetical protein
MKEGQKQKDDFNRSRNEEHTALEKQVRLWFHSVCPCFLVSVFCFLFPQRLVLHHAVFAIWIK